MRPGEASWSAPVLWRFGKGFGLEGKARIGFHEFMDSAPHPKGLVTNFIEMTPRCKAALSYAKESLARFGHSHMSSAHLVLGLLTLKGGVADNALRKSGFSVESVEAYLSSRRSSTEEATIRDGVAFGLSAKSALDRAEASVRERRVTYCGVEDLLLGILSEERGEAADMFASVHVDREELKRLIVEELRY